MAPDVQDLELQFDRLEHLGQLPAYLEALVE
jgi:hypothetical protein